MYCSRLSIHVCGSVNVELKSRDKVAKFCFFDDLANKKFTWLRTRTTQPPPSNMCFSKEMSMSFAIAGLAMSGWVWYRVSSPPSPHSPQPTVDSIQSAAPVGVGVGSCKVTRLIFSVMASCTLPSSPHRSGGLRLVFQWATRTPLMLSFL